ELVAPLDVDDLPRALSGALPEGVEVTAAAPLVERAPALQEAVTSVELRVVLAGMAPEQLETALQAARVASQLPVHTTRRGRPVVEGLGWSLRRLERRDDDGQCAIEVELSTHPRGTRPADLVTVVRELAGAPRTEGEDRVLRTCQWIERDGARLEPLEAD